MVLMLVSLSTWSFTFVFPEFLKWLICVDPLYIFGEFVQSGIVIYDFEKLNLTSFIFGSCMGYLLVVKT